MADHLDEPSPVINNSDEDSTFQSNLLRNPNNGDSDIPTGRSAEPLAKGISTMLAGIITDFDSRAEYASTSQDKLCSSIDRLTEELDQLLEDAPLPFIMQHAAKLSSVRRRVSSLNLLLRSIQRRLDNIDRVLSVGLPNDKSNVVAAK